MDTKQIKQREVKNKISDFVSHLKRQYGLSVDSVYLFGSYARGREREDSDIDICIISPLFDKEDALSYLWTRRRILDIQNLIAPVGFSPEDFRENYSPLIKEIKTYGVKI